MTLFSHRHVDGRQAAATSLMQRGKAVPTDPYNYYLTAWCGLIAHFSFLQLVLGVMHLPNVKEILNA